MTGFPAGEIQKEEKKMKKLLSLVLAVVMVLGLVACGGNAPETTAPVETTPAAPETTAAAVANVAEVKSLANSVYGEDYVSL